MMSASAKQPQIIKSKRVLRRTPLVSLSMVIVSAFIVAAIGSLPYLLGSGSYILLLTGKFLCFTIFALSIDLVWGFTRILSLGQSVYFGIGAYLVALSLRINYVRAHPTHHGDKVADSM